MFFIKKFRFMTSLVIVIFISLVVIKKKRFVCKRLGTYLYNFIKLYIILIVSDIIFIRDLDYVVTPVCVVLWMDVAHTSDRALITRDHYSSIQTYRLNCATHTTAFLVYHAETSIIFFMTVKILTRKIILISVLNIWLSWIFFIV